MMKEIQKSSFFLCISLVIISPALSSIANDQEEECVRLTGDCSEALLANMFSHIEDHQLICRDFSEFFECLRGPACHMLSDATRHEMADKMKTNLGKHGVRCLSSNKDTTTALPVFKKTESNECLEEVRVCSKIYMTGTQTSARYKQGEPFTWICPLLENYMRCLAKVTCLDISDNSQMVKNKLDQELAKWGVQCDFDTSVLGLTRRPLTTSPSPVDRTDPENIYSTPRTGQTQTPQVQPGKQTTKTQLKGAESGNRPVENRCHYYAPNMSITLKVTLIAAYICLVILLR